MLREVIVVEGKSDIARVSLAVEADMIATEGYTLRPAVVAQIRAAYEKRGIIILTDPDGPGERIRARLGALFPKALHAFVPKDEARTDNDVGIEDASPEAIRRALLKVRPMDLARQGDFTAADLFQAGLSGGQDASLRRDRMGAILGIGYGNSRTFLKRLNHFGVTRREWADALQRLAEASYD